jgi:hypothetical protein
MLKRFGLNDNKGLREIAEIVHDIDLKDDKFHRLEASGLNAIIHGLSETLRNDRKLVQHTGDIFDGLYSLYNKASTGKGGAKSRRGKAPKRE